MYPIIIFSIAFILRVVVGFIFYGSIDVGAFISINEHTFNNTLVLHPFTIWCAFPVIPFYLWLCGLLTIKTSLPLAFCFKTIPILFDSMLAVLIYDFVKRLRPEHAVTCGFLYALCPIALLITCIHGQWDAMPIFFFLLALYFRESIEGSWLHYCIYGALFAFSFLLKPITLVFAPFFFIPWPSLKKTLGSYWTILTFILSSALIVLITSFVFFKVNKVYSIDIILNLLDRQILLFLGGLILALIGSIFLLKPWRSFPIDFQRYLGLQASAVAGAILMVGVCFFFLWLYGFNLLRVIDKVLRYFNQGIAVFGLPFGYPFNQGVLYTILKNRFWIMGIISGVAVLYYTSKIDIYRSILASLMIIFSFSGLSPQYLMWAAPFFLIIGWYRAAALFNGICALFFLFYYMNPLTNPEVPYQSMLSFAPLKTFGWLLPPVFLTDAVWLPMIHVLGNYIIPALCLSIAVVLLYKSLKNNVSDDSSIRFSKQKTLIYILTCFALTSLIGVLMLVVDNVGFSEQFKNSITSKMLWYDTYSVGEYLSGRYGEIKPFNIVFLFFGLTVVWFMWSWRLGNDRKSL